MTSVPPHKPKFVVLKCSDGRLQLVLKRVFKDRAPGHFFKIINAGPLVPPYLFYRIMQQPFEWVAGKLLKATSRMRKGINNSPLGNEKVQAWSERSLYKVHYGLGWLAITGIYGAFRYAIAAKGVRNAIIVVHEACGAHEENLGPAGKDLWNRMIKRNAIDNMRKLGKLPDSRNIDNWHLWYVSFSKRGIQAFDHQSQTWKALSVAELEGVLGTKLEVAEVSDLFKEIWEDPSKDGHTDHDHAHDHTD